MDINDYLALCRILYALILTDIFKVWFIMVCNQSLSSFSRTFPHGVRDENAGALIYPTRQKLFFQLRNSDVAFQRKYMNAEGILNKPQNISREEQILFFLHKE